MIGFKSIRQVSRHRTSFGASQAPDPGARERLTIILAALGLLLIAGAYVAWTAVRSARDTADMRDPRTLCLANRPTPVADLVALDVTDTLASDAGARFTSLMRNVQDQLPRNGRLIIVPFGGNVGAPLQPAFDTCSPGKGDEADPMWEGKRRVERDYAARFERPLDSVASELLKIEPTGRSPIVEQLERMVADPAIAWRGETRRLTILTDGLEFTANSPVYTTGKVSLAQPPPTLLAGVEVNYVELTNPQHTALQTAALRAAWERWFRAAGASRVNMYAPGYPPPTPKPLP